MASNYAKIRRENIVEYGKGISHHHLYVHLYSDRTHFIYELLQNAEDAGATHVGITLHRNCLEVFHDGKKFDEADVKGICSLGKGTKSEDLTKIGKFGIGFKSVYAYTSAPQIHSGDEHFSIKHYVRPFEIDPIEIPDSWTTRFIFPFNSSIAAETDPFEEIATRLKGLNVRTLLFLRSISEIEWQIDSNESGLYIRETELSDTGRKVTVIGQVDDECDAEETWLVFEKETKEPNGKIVKPIEVAFLLASETQESGSKKIIATRESPLFVFFATEKETNLGFLLQGPYKTTPARDNIPRDDSYNSFLLNESAEHVVSVLHTLKEMGLLDVPVVETLPINDENFPAHSMFRPLYDRVAQALMEEALLPALGNGFTRGRDAAIGRGEDIRNLLSADQLRSLHGDKVQNPVWLSEAITTERTPALRRYLMTELGIEEITPESFAREVTKNFFSKQSDEWLVQFYIFLSRQEALWREAKSGRPDGPIRHKQFIRLTDGQQVSAFKKDGMVVVYLPHRSGRQLPTIKPELAENPDVEEFFKRLGIQEPDIITEVLENVLLSYESDEVDISEESHKEHINLILKALQVDSTKRRELLISELKKSYFLFGWSAETNQGCRKRPQDLYVGSDDLSVFLEGNPNAWFLDGQYTEDQINAFLELGVSNDLRTQCRSRNSKDHVTICGYHGCHKRGLDGFDPDCTVEGLEHAVQFPTVERSLFIWRSIAIPRQRQICGRVEKSTRQTYEDSEIERTVSTLGEILLSNSWLPDSTGEFHKPSELSLVDLHEDFDQDQGLADHLEMQGSEFVAMAKQSGLDASDLNLFRKLRQIPGGLKKMKEFIEQSERRPSFPKGPSKNPERRTERARQIAKTAQRKEFEKRPRNVRISQADGDKYMYLKESYTNEDGELICQMCEGEMPFRRRDGEHYFESVQLFDDLSGEHTAAHLALCPVCAAKYKEFVKRDSNNATLVCTSIRSSEKLVVSVNLGQDEGSIRFVEKHLVDILAVLDQESDVVGMR